MTTKLFVGLLPLFTACTIDFEMQLDVGLQEGADLDEVLEEGQSLFDEFSSDDTSDPDESMEVEGTEEESLEEEDLEEQTEGSDPDQNDEEESPICTIEISAPSEVLVDEDIFVEWTIHGEPQADTVIALLNEMETIHLDFLLMEESDYMLPSLSEQGEYLVYVASGADLNTPDCFVMAPVNVFADTQTSAEPEFEQDAEVATCDSDNPERSIEQSLVVQAGSSVVLEWDTRLGEFVEIVMYELNRPEDVVVVDVISDDGSYELFVSEHIPRGVYGLSLVSDDMEVCLHFEIEVIHEV